MQQKMFTSHINVFFLALSALLLLFQVTVAH